MWMRLGLAFVFASRLSFPFLFFFFFLNYSKYIYLWKKYLFNMTRRTLESGVRLSQVFESEPFQSQPILKRGLANPHWLENHRI